VLDPASSPRVPLLDTEFCDEVVEVFEPKYAIPAQEVVSFSVVSVGAG
jgi:hypothetical protein